MALNWGYRCRRKPTDADDGRIPPEFYVSPVGVVRDVQDKASTWGKMSLKRIENPDGYLPDRAEIKSSLG